MISEMVKLLEFEAMMVSLGAADSIWAMIWRLRASLSGTHSTTSHESCSAELSSSGEWQRIGPAVASALLDDFRSPSMYATLSSSWQGWESIKWTLRPWLLHCDAVS